MKHWRLWLKIKEFGRFTRMIQFEGILRNDILRDNNTHRNSAYYSIINTEWAAVKPNLVELYQAKKNENS